MRTLLEPPWRGYAQKMPALQVIPLGCSRGETDPVQLRNDLDPHRFQAMLSVVWQRCAGRAGTDETPLQPLRVRLVPSLRNDAYTLSSLQVEAVERPDQKVDVPRMRACVGGWAKRSCSLSQMPFLEMECSPEQGPMQGMWIQMGPQIESYFR